MSRFQPADRPCPECGTPVTFRAYQSINADRAPSFREGVLDDSFQREACPSCGEEFRLDPELVYFDAELGLWIRALPLEQQLGWRQGEADTTKVHVQTFGPFAPPSVQNLSSGLTLRLTFGWAALREKLICAKSEIDDVSLETLKVLLLSRGFGDSVDDDAELRLYDITEGGLQLVWLMGPMEVPIEGFTAPLALLEEVKGPAWAETRASVSGDYFVDMNRALLEGDAALGAA